MTLPLRNDLDGFPTAIGWRGSEPPVGNVGVWLLSGPARVLSAMQWCWCGRKMAAYSSALTFAVWMLAWKKDSYALPRIQEALESLVGAGHFSCLDLKSGFWQIKMEEALKQYTVFTVGNFGFLECNCMPFRLCNVPATFQWLMPWSTGAHMRMHVVYCMLQNIFSNLSSVSAIYFSKTGILRQFTRSR